MGMTEEEIAAQAVEAKAMKEVPEEVETSISLEEAKEILANVPTEVGDELIATFYTTDKMKELLTKFADGKEVPEVLGEKRMRVVSKGKTFIRAEWVGRIPRKDLFEKYEVEKGYKLQSKGNQRTIVLGKPQTQETK